MKGRKKNRSEVKPCSGLNVEELLQSDSGKKVNQISPQNAIPDFRQMLDNVANISGIRDAVTQLGSIVETQIKDSFGDINYGRAIAELDIMRREMIEMDEPALYNDFVRNLKTKLLKGELSGDRRDMWYELKKAELGLIDSKQSELSAVTKEEAKQVSFVLVRFCIYPSPYVNDGSPSFYLPIYSDKTSFPVHLNMILGLPFLIRGCISFCQAMYFSRNIGC